MMGCFLVLVRRHKPWCFKTALPALTNIVQSAAHHSHIRNELWVRHIVFDQNPESALQPSKSLLNNTPSSDEPIIEAFLLWSDRIGETFHHCLRKTERSISNKVGQYFAIVDCYWWWMKPAPGDYIVAQAGVGIRWCITDRSWVSDVHIRKYASGIYGPQQQNSYPLLVAPVRIAVHSEASLFQRMFHPQLLHIVEGSTTLQNQPRLDAVLALSETWYYPAPKNFEGFWPFRAQFSGQ